MKVYREVNALHSWTKAANQLYTEKYSYDIWINNVWIISTLYFMGTLSGRVWDFTEEKPIDIVRII